MPEEVVLVKNEEKELEQKSRRRSVLFFSSNGTHSSVSHPSLERVVPSLETSGKVEVSCVGSWLG